MAFIDESTEIFLQDLIEYISDGNEVLVKSSDFLIMSRVISPIVSTIVIYRGEKLSTQINPGDFDTLNTNIFQFIIRTDRKFK